MTPNTAEVLWIAARRLDDATKDDTPFALVLLGVVLILIGILVIWGSVHEAKNHGNYSPSLDDLNRRSEEEELLVRQDSMTAQVSVTGGQTGPIDQAALDQMIAPLEALPGCTRGIWEHPRKPTSGSGTGLRRGDKDPWPLILETNSLEVFSVPDQTPAE